MYTLLKGMVVVIATIPLLVSAQIVECQQDCGWSDFIVLIDNLLGWLVTILVIIATILLVVAGFKMVTSGGDKSAWESAKKMFTDVVIGIIIVLAAWLIIDTVLSVLTDRGGINAWLNFSSNESVDPNLGEFGGPGRDIGN